MPKPSLHSFDKKGLAAPCSGIIGVDEAGRGCFAGPVMAAAVFIPRELYDHRSFLKTFRSANDSKQLSAEERSYFFEQLELWRNRDGLQWAHAEASVQEIEQHSIVGATILAMERSLQGLAMELPCPELIDDLPLFSLSTASSEPTKAMPLIWVDGRPLKALKHSHTGWVQGDSKSLAIALASIIAKVTRDRLMQRLHMQFSQYGFDQHKGYGTVAHREALSIHGPCDHHRLSFLSKCESVQKEIIF